MRRLKRKHSRIDWEFPPQGIPHSCWFFRHRIVHTVTPMRCTKLESRLTLKENEQRRRENNQCIVRDSMFRIAPPFFQRSSRSTQLACTLILPSKSRIRNRTVAPYMGVRGFGEGNFGSLEHHEGHFPLVTVTTEVCTRTHNQETKPHSV